MATYKKLPGRSRAVGGYSRLWQGEDHLLLVTMSGVNEEYRRFYYSDIQAFIVRKTFHGVIANCLWGATAIFGAIGFALPPAGALFFWAIGLIGIAGLSINAALGPSSICYIQTATARHSVPTLRRIRNARKVIDRILPLIAQAQGELPPEKLNEAFVLESAANAPPVLGS